MMSSMTSERLAPGASCKDKVSSINANIVVVFLGYTCLKKISINNTFRDRRSKVNVTGLLGDLVTQTAVTPSIFGLSRWNKNWNVRNSYSYVATVTKIRFHLQFQRSPDATFGGHIEWLFNWKCKFSCRITSNIANIMSNTINFEMVTASILSRWDFENSQISAQDTLLASQVPHSSFSMLSLTGYVSFLKNNFHHHLMLEYIA